MPETRQDYSKCLISETGFEASFNALSIGASVNDFGKLLKKNEHLYVSEGSVLTSSISIPLSIL